VGTFLPASKNDVRADNGLLSNLRPLPSDDILGDSELLRIAGTILLFCQELVTGGEDGAAGGTERVGGLIMPRCEGGLDSCNDTLGDGLGLGSRYDALGEAAGEMIGMGTFFCEGVEAITLSIF
jgi:hypothetical protein